MFNLEAIVVGAGPSARLLKDISLPSTCKIYGCGNVTSYMKVDVYAYGDIVHKSNIPPAPAITFGSERNFNDVEGLQLFDGTMPTGKSSGGMAISLACKEHNTIGIIGFDGYNSDGSLYDPPGQIGQMYCMGFWIGRGKTLISLMNKSVFNDYLQQCDHPNKQCDHPNKMDSPQPLYYFYYCPDCGYMETVM